MFKNYLKIAYRNIIKQKAYSLINILGLALGLAACILAGLYIWQNLHYDEYHANKDNIYRISVETVTPNGTFHMAETPALVAPTLQENFPEIDKITRIFFSSNDLVSYDEKKFYEDEIVFADKDFFEMFTYETINGNPVKFLKDKNTIVITNHMAEKYFGKENPIGKIVTLNNALNMEVVGVIENVPTNSHFTFDMVATYETLEDTPVGNYLDQWGATFGSYTYIMPHQGTDIQELENKINTFFLQVLPLVEGVTQKGIMQPLTSIHLHSHLSGEINPGSSLTYILVLGSISLFILILACINFVNLTTARAVKRAREIGVRKVFGAMKRQLVRQFLCESVVLTCIALCLAFVFVELLKPAFSDLIGAKLLYDTFSSAWIFLTILISTLSIGLLAGLYPAFVLTQYKTVYVIKGNETMLMGKKGSNILRKGLVLFQFSISIILIIFTLTINRQVHYMRGFDMGFKKDQTIILKTPNRMSKNFETIKNEMNSVPGVLKTSTSLGVPVFERGFGTNLVPDTQHEDNSFMVSVQMIDFDFLDLYDLDLIAGQRLSDLQGADYRAVTIVNETTVKKLGFASPEEALGHAYTIGLSDGVKRFEPEIIGVVKDFHFNSLHDEVSPLLFMYWPYLFEEISLRVSPVNMHETIKGIEKVWNTFYPEYPFTYSFLDEQVEKMYRAEERSFHVITTFSVLAIFIACLGLLGLTFYTTEQRKKEIGIRKVLGASVPDIINKISREFLMLIIISNAVAWPLSYFIILKWLSGFPYKVSISIMTFIAAGALALSIALITMSYTVIKSAITNPIKTIKYE